MNSVTRLGFGMLENNDRLVEWHRMVLYGSIEPYQSSMCSWYGHVIELHDFTINMVGIFNQEIWDAHI